MGERGKKIVFQACVVVVISICVGAGLSWHKLD